MNIVASLLIETNFRSLEATLGPLAQVASAVLDLIGSTAVVGTTVAIILFDIRPHQWQGSCFFTGVSQVTSAPNERMENNHE